MKYVDVLEHGVFTLMTCIALITMCHAVCICFRNIVTFSLILKHSKLGVLTYYFLVPLLSEFLSSIQMLSKTCCGTSHVQIF